MTSEIGRKVLHLLSGISILLMLIYGLLNVKIMFYILIFGCFLSILSMKVRLPGLSWLLDNFERKNEKIPGKSSLFFLAGSILALRLFSFDIALASIAVLTFADSLSNMTGRVFGRRKFVLNKYKNIEGILFGIIIGTLSAMFFVNFTEAFVASFFAMFIEAIEIKVSDEHIDDNLLIPLVAGTVMFLLRIWF